jgi:hypothetical protein
MVIFFIPIIMFFTEYVQPAKISSTFPTFQDSTPVERIIKRLLNPEEEQKRKEEKIKNEKEEEKEDKSKEKEKNKENENKKDKSITESKKKE